jgi:hypothetical protein
MFKSFLKGCSFLVVTLFLLGFVALVLIGRSSNSGSETGGMSLLRKVTDFAASAFSGPGNETRQWKDRQGRTLNGALVAGSQEEALIRVLPANRIYRVPLSRLSEADGLYVREHKIDDSSFGDLYPELRNQWPQKIEGRQQAINLTPGENGKIWNSTHYEFRSDAPVDPKLAEGMAVTCEAIDFALKGAPLPLTWGRSSEKKRVVVLYHSDADFYQSGAQKNWGAYYNGLSNQVHVPLSALNTPKVQGMPSRYTLDKRNSYKIFVHEMVHQACVNLSALNLPAWVPEGTAELFSAMQTSPGYFNFTNHPVQIRRHLIEKLGGEEIWQMKELELPNLDRFLTLGLYGFNKTTAASPDGGYCEYSAALLLTEYFCFADGNSFRHYLEAVLTGVNQKTAMETHLMRGRTPGEIEGLIAARWKELGMTIRFVNNPQLREGQLKADVGIESKLSSPF